MAFFRRFALIGLTSIVALFSTFSLAATPLDINSATAEELSVVMSGIGLVNAEAIVAYRDQHGPFQTLEELTAVKGIGAATVEKNREVLRVVQPNGDTVATVE